MENTNKKTAKEYREMLILKGIGSELEKMACPKISNLKSMLETFDEVIYVDWNSPTHSFLYEVLDMIPKTGRLKHFAIPPEYALMMSNNNEKAQVCNSVLSFNLGLRRTDAEWVVITTSDIIAPFKNDFLEFLKTCNKNTFYTLSRRETDYEKVIENKYAFTLTCIFASEISYEYLY
mgnify:CR=1 FL=1